MLTRFHIAIALLYTPEFSSLTFFAGVFVISWNSYCFYCIFVILGRVSDAVGRGYVFGTTVRWTSAFSPPNFLGWGQRKRRRRPPERNVWRRIGSGGGDCTFRAGPSRLQVASLDVESNVWRRIREEAVEKGLEAEAVTAPSGPVPVGCKSIGSIVGSIVGLVEVLSVVLLLEVFVFVIISS